MVNIESHVEPIPVPVNLIDDAARSTLAQQGAAGDLTIVLSDDPHLRELNREYLGMDAPTDVLSFPAAERDPESGATYLGDVIISIPQADAQARGAGHPLEAEVQLLVIHGVLHLLGHDHAETESRSRMWSAQSQVLRKLGLPDLVIRE